MPSFPFAPAPRSQATGATGGAPGPSGFSAPRSQATGATGGAPGPTGFAASRSQASSGAPAGVPPGPNLATGPKPGPSNAAVRNNAAFGSQQGGFERARGQSTADSGGFFSTNGIGILQGGARGAAITAAGVGAGLVRAAVLGDRSSTVQMVKGWMNAGEARANALTAKGKFEQLGHFEPITDFDIPSGFNKKRDNQGFKKQGFGPKRTEDATPGLIAYDDGYTDVWFQFAPESLSHSLSQNWAEGHGLTRHHPVLQWVRGAQEVFSFEAMFFAPTPEYPSIEAMWDAVSSIVAAMKPSKKLGRPPIWDLVWGNIGFGQVVVESLGQLRYVEMQETLAGNNFPREARMTVTLRKYTPFDFEITTRNPSKRDTLYATAKLNEQWEHIAARMYGNPHHGDTLRKLFPAAPIPVPGAIYKLPDRAKLEDPNPRPDSVPLAWTDAGIAMRDSLFATRARPFYSAMVT